jgi:hypothetical protein
MAISKKSGKALWIVLAAFVIAIAIAAQMGFIGYGWAHLGAAIWPRDHGLLRHVPGDTTAVVIVDPHQLDLGALGPDPSTPRTFLLRVREDVRKATGIDLGFDTDKLLISPNLVVARGRFNDDKLAERLAELRYTRAEYKGVGYLVRQGEDAIAVIGGSILLYGDEPSIQASIDARESDKSLKENSEVTERLSQMGWDRPVLVTARMAEERPSLRAILTGSTGPRAVTVGISHAPANTPGLDVAVSIEAASPSAAEELSKLLLEKQKDLESFRGVLGPDIMPLLSGIAEKATIKVEAGSSVVSVRVHTDKDALEKAIKAAGQSVPLADAYKTLRLYQLLAPPP